MDIIKLLFDPYDRKARLYPVLLALSAPVLIVMIAFPANLNQFYSTVPIMLVSGFLMFLCNVGRERGKNLENGLFERWGGTPTTQMLMYQSTSLEFVTLARYRRILEACISGLKFLDKEQEKLDPNGAADVCRSAVRWLRETTRDVKKYPVIFAENVNYGFRRNLFGVKPSAIFLCFFTFVVLELFTWFANGNVASNHILLMESLLILISLLWYIIVNERFVKTAAFAYATALFLACDSQQLIK